MHGIQTYCVSYYTHLQKLIDLEKINRDAIMLLMIHIVMLSHCVIRHVYYF